MATVVFDLDGTLADTSGDLIAAANASLRDLGPRACLDPVADRAVAFMGGRAMLALGLSRARPALDADARADAVAARVSGFLAEYGENIATRTALFPGALDALAALRAAGYGLALCTNKPIGLTRALLPRLGLDDRFDAVIGAGSLDWVKPDPRPYRAAVKAAGGAVARSLLVGDSVTDRDTARAAGVPCLLVDFGALSGDLGVHDPAGVLSDFAALPGLVTGLLPRGAP